MYAVIKAGGKQHKVQTGDVIKVELGEGAPGDTITFQPLLVVDDTGGTHAGKETGKAVVKAKVLGEIKGKKVRVFKYRNKTGYSRRQGHRQQYSELEIQEVGLGAAPKKAAAPKAKADAGAGAPDPAGDAS